MSAIGEITGHSPRMTQTPPKPRSYGLCVGCVRCGCKLDDPKVETTVMGMVERIDYLLALARGRGWKTSRQGREATVECPDCQKRAEKAQKDPLPPFIEVCACAKCGAPDMGMKFCDGRTMCAIDSVRDHLHRDCPRCGYSFVQACKDQANGT